LAGSLALSKYTDEGDIVHDTLMKLPEHACSLLAAHSIQLMRRLVRTFSQFVTSQGWGFSYTDDIAAVCSSLFHAIEDAEIQSEQLVAVLLVGVGPNRWVMSTFAGLLQGIDSD